MNNTWRSVTAWSGDATTPGWEVQQGTWEKTADGIRILTPTRMIAFFAERPCGQWRVRIRSVAGDGMLYVEADEYAFDIGGAKRPASRIYQSWGGTVVLAATGRCPREDGAAHDILCERGGGKVALKIDAATLLIAEDPAPEQRLVHFTLFIPAGVIVGGVELEAREIATDHPVRVTPRGEFALDVCVDFLDDMILCAWNPDTLDAAMKFYERNRIRRVHVIYTGSYHDGFYDRRGMDQQYPGIQGRIDRTYAQIGDFLPAFTKAAHMHGIETIAVFKPFETAFGYSVPYGSKEAAQRGKIPSLGGMLFWALNFTAAHPHLRMERDMSDVPADLDQRRIGRIVLTAEKGLVSRIDPQRLSLWVSCDNGRYTLLEGAVPVCEEHEGAQRIIFENLDLPEHFAAVLYQGEGPSGFGNRLGELIAVYDTEGRRLPITPAFGKGRNARSDFRESGFDMDSAGATCFEDFHWIEPRRPLAFGLGRNRYISGALCPAYPEVQDWWMLMVEQCLAAGVDGIDFRLHHHNRAPDWGAYHFNEPVVRAFRERYGVDIRAEPFDRETLRNLQGEFYTAFLRRARRRLTEAKASMHAHIEMRAYPPRWPTYMEIRFPWEQWVAEGLVDEVTLKSYRTLRSGAALKAIEHLRRATGVRINTCPYLNDLVSQPNGPAQLDFHIRDSLAAGVDGYILYENAAMMSGCEDGTVRIIHPWVMESLTKHARAPR